MKGISELPKIFKETPLDIIIEGRFPKVAKAIKKEREYQLAIELIYKKYGFGQWENFDRDYPYFPPKNELFKLASRFKYKEGRCVYTRVNLWSKKKSKQTCYYLIFKGQTGNRRKDFCYKECKEFLELAFEPKRNSKYKTKAIVLVSGLVKNLSQINKIRFNMMTASLGLFKMEYKFESDFRK